MAIVPGLSWLFTGTNDPFATLWSLCWSEAPPGESSHPFHQGLVSHTAQPLCAWRMCLDFSLVLNLHMMASAGNHFHHSQLAQRPYLSWPGQARCVSTPWHQGNVTALSRVQEVLGECQPSPAQPRRMHLVGSVSPSRCLPSGCQMNFKVSVSRTRYSAAQLLSPRWVTAEENSSLQAKLNSPPKGKAHSCGRSRASQSSTVKYRPIFPG